MSTSSISAWFAALLATLGTGFALFMLFFILAFLVMLIIEYVFKSLAFYRFMKNRNIENAFLAWIPIVRAYSVGKVYADINAKQDEKTNFGVILLTINCIHWFFILFPKFGVFGAVFGIINLGLSLALLVLNLICFNLIFKKYTPGNSTYFVLTVIFSIIPIVPFIPGLCLLKASKNQPVSEAGNE